MKPINLFQMQSMWGQNTHSALKAQAVQTVVTGDHVDT